VLSYANKSQGFLASLEKQTLEIGVFKYAEEALRQKFDEDAMKMR
jgi:hypothetical protein